MAEPSSSQPRFRGHEVADVSGRRIAWVAVGLVVSLIVVALLAYAARALLGPERPNAPANTQVPTQAIAAAAPQPQITPALDLKALREQKSAMLDGYRWIDQKQGVVQIPIERAMQLTAERSATRRPAAQKQTEPPK